MWILFILTAFMVLTIFTPLLDIVHDWLSLKGFRFPKGVETHSFCGSCCIKGASGQTCDFVECVLLRHDATVQQYIVCVVKC